MSAARPGGGPGPYPGLAKDLRRAVSGEVRFDAAARAMYAHDASNYRLVPLGVVVPRDAEDAAAAIGVARDHDAPVLSRGGGTSLSGQTVNAAVVLDWSQHVNRILALDPDARTARVEPGVVLDDLRDAAGRHGLTYGPDPATHNRCTLGGMIGNNSCGVHSIMAGKTEDNVLSLDVLTYRGERLRVGAGAGLRGDDERAILADLRALRDRHAGAIRTRFPDIPRRVSGYNLPALLPEQGFDVARALVGSESTCVTVLEATVRLVHSPPHRALALVPFQDICAAADGMAEVPRDGLVGLEGFDEALADLMRRNHQHVGDLGLLPHGGAWLMAEYGGETAAEACDRAGDCVGRHAGGRLLDDPGEQARAWQIREAALGASRLMPDGTRCWPGFDDAAVAPERLGDYLRDFRVLLRRYGYTCMLYGHFGHGCVHSEISFDLVTADGVAAFRSFVRDAAELVVSYGGSISGEHGDGQARGELLPIMYGAEIVDAMREFKGIWDPDGRMNPGKVVDPRPLDADLRLGPTYRPPHIRTAFAYPDDGGSFARAANRCAGIGLCRRHDAGTMCPSYMVTRDEKHSTRGRARLLFELLQGDPLAGAHAEAEVLDALDLCLACKGCLHECPVQVDMATYKAELLHHRYRRRLRPRSAYAMGLIQVWAPLGVRAAPAVNALARLPVTGALARRAAGIAPERDLPAFARRTLRSAVAARRGAPPPPTRGPVVLFADTFTDHFHVRTGVAAIRALEAAGYEVRVPRRRLCCGRPLYDYGMLGLARRTLVRTLAGLRGALRAGTPIVVLEPSCLATFRDELVKLFPDDEDARRLSAQVRTLAELLVDDAEGWEPPRLGGRALVHGHCHQRALGGIAAELELLRRLGVAVEEPDEGCCGMAGSFGFERRHYDVSAAVGERRLLPAVRAADPSTLIVANGFSCREQVRQLAGRDAVHMADVVSAALAAGPG